MSADIFSGVIARSNITANDALPQSVSALCFEAVHEDTTEWSRHSLWTDNDVVETKKETEFGAFKLAMERTARDIRFVFWNKVMAFDTKSNHIQ